MWNLINGRLGAGHEEVFWENQRGLWKANWTACNRAIYYERPEIYQRLPQAAKRIRSARHQSPNAAGSAGMKRASGVEAQKFAVKVLKSCGGLALSGCGDYLSARRFLTTKCAARARSLFSFFGRRSTLSGGLTWILAVYTLYRLKCALGA